MTTPERFDAMLDQFQAAYLWQWLREHTADADRRATYTDRRGEATARYWRAYHEGNEAQQ